MRYIDSPVLRDRDADGSAGSGNLGAAASGMEQRVYYLTDGNFNVTALADPNGAVLERYTYDAYGQACVYDPNWAYRGYSSYANAILFCGYFRDWETGMYHVRNRYCHGGPACREWDNFRAFRGGIVYNADNENTAFGLFGGELDSTGRVEASVACPGSKEAWLNTLG